MIYSAERYTELYNIEFLGIEEEISQIVTPCSINGYRTKTYKAGKVKEVEIFPLWITRTERKRAERAKKTSAAQEAVNARNCAKKIARLANNNFTDDDLLLDLNYRRGNTPETIEDAKKELQNYIKKLKRYRENKKLPALRYIAATEYKDADGEIIHIHHHLIISGDMDRDEVEKMWKNGDRTRTRRVALTYEHLGLTGQAFYIAKATSNGMIWSHSKNLKMPQPTISDRKITRRQVQKLAASTEYSREIFEKKFPGYKLRSIKIKYSPFVAGAYIYAQLFKEAGNERWQFG